MDKLNGIILIDKTHGLSSAETVSRVKKLCRVSRVGHTGTLDPGATGLLILTLGKATKISAYLSNEVKSYRAVIYLGESRDSYDRFGKITDGSECLLNESQIESALTDFRGEIEQIIPPYSAVHHDGKRMYELAREGLEIPAKYRKVKITELDLLGYQKPLLSIDVVCSSGTYIRSIAHELGKKLGCGAHLAGLIRTSVGKFQLGNAITLSQLEAVVKLRRLNDYIIPIHEVLSLPSLIINDNKCEGVQYGQDILNRDIMKLGPDFTAGDTIAVKNKLGNLLAIGTALISSQKVRQNVVPSEKILEYKRVI